MLAGCASAGPSTNAPPAPVQHPNAVIAVIGPTEVVKQRISKKAPKGEDSVSLQIAFQQDAAADGCVNGANDPRKKLPPVAMFRESSALDLRLGDGSQARVRMFTVSDTELPPSVRIVAGNYALRDVTVGWGKKDGALVGSSKYSLAFRATGGPAFVGMFHLGLTAQDEVVLEDMEATDQVVAEAARLLGLAGRIAPMAVTEVRELKRCGPAGGITQLK